MTTLRMTFFALCISALALGCGDDSDGSGGDGTGGTGTGGTGGSDVDGGGDGSVMATISGNVTAEGEVNDIPIEGATVTAVGTGVSTTTDANGEFTMMVPVGEVFITTAAAGHWGFGNLVDVPASGSMNAELQVIADAMIDEIGTAIGATVDSAAGIVAAEFSGPSGLGGDTLSLSATAGIVFAIGNELEGTPPECNDFAPVVRNDLPANACPGEDPPETLVFANVSVSDSPVTASNIMPSGGYACELESTTPVPVVAKTIVLMDLACTPPVMP